MNGFIKTIVIVLLFSAKSVLGQEVEIEIPAVIKNSLTLSNTYYFSDLDNGVIQSDPEISSSDIILSANDGVALDIGKQDTEAQFAIYHQNILIHDVDQNGNMYTRGGSQVGLTGSLLKNLRGGSITIGADNGVNDILDTVNGKAMVTHTFSTAFSTVPHITATARHPASTSFPDTFSVTIQSVSATSVTFLVQRTDSAAGWGMDLLLDWWGFEL